MTCLMITNCDKKNENTGTPVGKLKIDLGLKVQVYDIYKSVKAAVPDEFEVIIFAADGSQIKHYENAGEMPAEIELPAGSYYAEANSRNNLPAAFENDYYFGETELFEISPGQTQNVTLECSLANIMVTVVYLESVTDNFSSYSTTVSNGGGSLIYASDETRAGFFDAGPLSIETNLFFDNGVGGTDSKTLTGVINNAEIGKHYEIQVDAAAIGGTAGITLSVDESYETEIISISDAPVQGPIATGDLLITEIMPNPAALGDTEGEYIEVYNTTDEVVDLNQVVLVRVSSGSRHVINEEILIDPHAWAVLARTASAATVVDYVYGSAITLPNSEEEIQLANYGTDGTDGSLIFAIDYGSAGFPTVPSGASLQLSAGITGVGEAANGLNWCVSTTAFSTGDLGSPGTANAGCGD